MFPKDITPDIHGILPRRPIKSGITDPTHKNDDKNIKTEKDDIVCKANALNTTLSEMGLLAVVFARKGDVERVLEGPADVNGNGLVASRECVGKVVERLAVVNDLLTADYEGQDALARVAVRLALHGVQDWVGLDCRTHNVTVHAGLQSQVIEVDLTNLLTQEVVVEGNIALGA
jgi:hypothetical protein